MPFRKDMKAGNRVQLEHDGVLIDLEVVRTEHNKKLVLLITAPDVVKINHRRETLRLRQAT